MGISHLVVGATFNPDSPIEHALVDGLIEFSRWMRAHDVSIAMQEPIGNYQADFVLRMPGKSPLVVECDGKYHRKSERARLDMVRDAHMAALGLRVHRIPGVDLWRFPTRCARIALETLSGDAFVHENHPGHQQEAHEALVERVRTHQPCEHCGGADCDHGLESHDCDGQCDRDHDDDDDGNHDGQWGRGMAWSKINHKAGGLNRG